MYTYQHYGKSLWESLIYALYSGFVMGYNPQESLENTIHTILRFQGIHMESSMGVPLAGDMRSGRGKRGKGWWLSGIV